MQQVADDRELIEWCVANLERGYGRRIENEKAPGIAPGVWALGFSDLLDNVGGARRLVREAIERVRRRQMG